MGLSENVGYIPNEIAIFHRDNDQQNHWVQWGTNHFQTHPNHITMEHHHFYWENPLFLWPCSIVMLVYQRVNPLSSEELFYDVTPITHWMSGLALS